MPSRILIVDDLQPYLESLSRALRDYEVVTARTLAEAKEQFDESISLALVDVRLDEDDDSNRDGLVLLQWLKAQSPNLPVIMMSAYRDFDAVHGAWNQQATSFLVKPINLRELKELLRTTLKQDSA